MRKSTYNIAILLCAALALAGCGELERFGWRNGDTIKFGAGTKGNVLTKTSYGDVTADTHQMIDWLEGDIIRITCAQASTAEGTSTSADYKTSAGSKSGAESRATLSLASNNNKGLRWGSESATHKFYGVYPSPATVGKSGDKLSDEGVLTGSIPGSQTPASISGTTDFVASPDMTNQYMVAKKTVAAGKQSFEDGEVFLYFTPITTAIEFEVTNVMTDDLAISSIELISTRSNLSGGFTTSLTGLNETGASYSNYPNVTAATGAKKNSSVSFGTNGLALGVNKKLTFTIFLLPESNLDDLTFRINKKGEGAGYIQTALKSDASTWLSFDRCKKHFVKGLFANDGAKWTVGFNPDVYPWDVHDSVEKALVDPAAALPSGLVSWEIVDEGGIALSDISYRFELENPDDATKKFSNPAETSSYDIPVTSVKTESDTPDASHGWTVKSYVVGSGSPVTVTGDAFTIDGLTVAKDGKKLTVTDTRTLIDKASHEYWVGNNGNWSPSANTTTTDLSKYDFEADKARSTMRTANCYVIRHAGTYRIPLVYGNAIDEVAVSGGINSAAYAGVSGGLNPFINSLNNKIKDPFIENHTYDGSAIANNHKTDLVATSASVVWQDEDAVVSNVSITPSTGLQAGSYTKKNVRYIEFTVNSSNIRQNNAVIAVYGRDKDGKNDAAILWSWHIWITNDPGLLSGSIPVTNATSEPYNFFPLHCLGWIEPPYYEVKDDVVVTLEQEESGKTETVTIKQPAYHYPGNGTYYQYGRKDPMPRKDNLVGGTVSTMTRTDVAGTSGVNIDVSIWQPQTFYYSSNGNFGNWAQTKYYNLWTGKYNSSGTSVDNTSTMIKTVYDPCPVGYKVPASKAFTAFATLPSTPMTELNGFTFQAGGRTIFFPACGMRTYKTTNFGISGGVTYNAGDVARLGLNAYYVTAISSDTNTDSGENSYKVFTLGFNMSSITTENKNVRANGMSVRPVKE